MAELRAAEIYFIAVGSVMLVVLCFQPLTKITQALGRAWHYGMLPYLVKRHRLLGPITYLEALSLTAYLAASTLAILVGSSSTAEISSRSAILATGSYLILFLGGSSSILIHALGLSWLPVSKIHTTIAIVVAVKCMIHVSLEIPRSSIDARGISGIIAGSLIVLILILGMLRRLLYELVRGIHFMLALATLWCLYVHAKRNAIRISLLVAGSLSLVGAFAKVLRMLYRSYFFGTERAQIEVVRRQGDAREDAIRMLVPLRKKWDFRAGQYVLLCVPQASVTASMQMHPFAVYYWAKRTRHGRDIWYLGLLIQPRRGFTANLIRARRAEVTALIDGPYGRPYRHLRNYGTIILVASGMGVASVIPVIKEALAFAAGESCVRRVHLLWDAEDYFYGDCSSLRHELQDCLDHDKRSSQSTPLLQISVYAASNKSLPVSKRLRFYCGDFTVDPHVTDELRGAIGDIAMFVSSHGTIRDQVREAVRKCKRAARLEHLLYQPASISSPALACKESAS